MWLEADSLPQEQAIDGAEERGVFAPLSGGEFDCQLSFREPLLLDVFIYPCERGRGVGVLSTPAHEDP